MRKLFSIVLVLYAFIFMQTFSSFADGTPSDALQSSSSVASSYSGIASADITAIVLFTIFAVGLLGIIIALFVRRKK